MVAIGIALIIGILVSGIAIAYVGHRAMELDRQRFQCSAEMCRLLIDGMN